MRLEADEGRPETSPPLRRGVQTADRAVVRERQAIPGDQGRVRHRAIDPAALGPRHPQQRLHPGHGQPHARAERAGRAGGGATGGWRWRWTFQDKRRRYSHEGRRDTGLRGEAREPGLVDPRHVRFGPSARIRARMPRSHMMPPMRLPDAVTPTAHQQYFVSSFRLEGLPIIWRKI